MKNSTNTTSIRITKELDRLEASLPAIPAKTVSFGRAMARRTSSVACSIIGEVSDRTDNVGAAISTATRTATGQARSAVGRSATAARNAASETIGQTRAQSAAVVDAVQHETEALLDNAADAVDPAPTNPASLKDLTKAELYDRAQDANIEGRSAMSKDDLVRALRR